MKPTIVSLALLLAACCPAPAVPESTPALEAAPSLCKRECAALAKLDCEEARPTPGGQTCPDVCVAAANVGSFPPASCVEAATTCSAASACRTRR